MQISPNNFIPTQNNLNNINQEQLSKQLKDYQVEPQKPSNNSNTNIIDPTTYKKKSMEAIEKTVAKLDEEFKQHLKEMEQTKTAMLTSYNEFNSFKEEQANLNPSLDLKDLDLYQEEDGTLKLSSSKLNSEQLALLELKINDNETLKQAMTDLHRGVALATNLARTSEEGLKQDDFVKVNAQDFVGTLRLNDLITSYTSKVEEKDIADNMNTTEERIKKVSTLLMSGFLTQSVMPKVNILV